MKKEKTKKEITVNTVDTEKLKELENVSDERWKKRSKARSKLIWKRIGVGFMVFMVAVYCAVGIGGLWFAQKLLKGMPELRIADFISEESSKIYDANGSLVTEIGTYYRENITYEDCPEVLIDAFLAVEDSRFKGGHRNPDPSQYPGRFHLHDAAGQEYLLLDRRYRDRRCRT